MPFSATHWPAEEVPREASPLAAGPERQPQGLALPPVHSLCLGRRAALRQRISHFSLGAPVGWGKENHAYLQGWKVVAKWKTRI